MKALIIPPVIVIVSIIGFSPQASAWMAVVASRSSYQTYAFGWGNGGDGKVGDGTTTTRIAPTIIDSPVPRGWTKIDAGNNHACGIAGGIAYCWGLNTNGQIGTGNTTSPQATPVAVTGGITGWTDIDAGETHTCGIANGNAYCWGSNVSGALGIGSGSTGDRTSPRSVGGSDWLSIKAGKNYSCGIRSGGDGYCWGESQYGRLGDNQAVADRTSPVSINGSYNWAMLAIAEDTSCGITTAGTLYCWGENSGTVGDNTTTDRNIPTLQYNTSGWTWKDVTIGTNHGCAIRSDGANNGRLYCWGNNSFGRKQVNNNNGYPEEAKQNNGSGAAFTDWTKISAMWVHTCGIRNNGNIHCWGSQNNGKLADGNNHAFNQTNLSTSSITGITDSEYTWVDVSAGPDNTYAIRKERGITASTGSGGVGHNKTTGP